MPDAQPITIPPNSYAGFSVDPNTGMTSVVVYDTQPVGDGDNGGTVDPRVTQAAVLATVQFLLGLLPKLPA